MVESIHIHEDDEGMRNLYPLAAQAEAAADVIEAHAAGVRNRDPSGLGWTDVHMIRPPSISYVDVGLRLSQTASALESIMPRVKTFTSTATAGFLDGHDAYGSYQTEAWCFGHGADCFIKLEPKGEFVEHIWFELRGVTADAVALRAAIEAIHRLAPSYIADYWADFAGPADEAGLDQYFALLAAD